MVNNYWLECGLDPTGLNYVKARGPKNLAFEAINGNLSIKVNWTDEAKESDYSPSKETLSMEGVVVGSILVDLVDASRKIAESGSGPFTVTIHASSLKLSIETRGELTVIKVVERIRWSNTARVLGSLKLSRNSFLEGVARVLDGFAKHLVSANPSLADHRTLRFLRKEMEEIRPRY